MKQLTALFLVTAAACGNATFPDEPAGDDTVDAGPDGEMTEPPVDPAVLTIVPRAVLDERADTIAFGTGEPVHTHTGPTVMFGGPGCPDLARYAYLLDKHPPYGKDAAPNPLALTVALPAGLVDGSASYRVTAGVWASAWIALPGDGGERATIALYRDDIPALGSLDGEIRVEVRAGVGSGGEQTATACWKHHPLAAPLAIDQPQLATGASSLDGRQLANGSSAIDIATTYGIREAETYTMLVVQQTAEPITLALAFPPPAGTYASTVVDTFAATQTSSVAHNCEAEPEYCDLSPLPAPLDLVRGGALASGRWQVHAIDEVSGARVDCPGGTCALPARSAAGARAFRIVVSLEGVSDLWQVPTTPNELAVGGHTVVGGWVSGNTLMRCRIVKAIGDTSVCASWVVYTELQALDRARLDLAALSVPIATGHGSGAIMAPVGYLPNSAVTAPARSWDGGDGPL